MRASGIEYSSSRPFYRKCSLISKIQLFRKKKKKTKAMVVFGFSAATAAHQAQPLPGTNNSSAKTTQDHINPTATKHETNHQTPLLKHPSQHPNRKPSPPPNSNTTEHNQQPDTAAEMPHSTKPQPSPTHLPLQVTPRAVVVVAETRRSRRDLRRQKIWGSMRLGFVISRLK
ncbi:hypothetical protein Droror1_Dr00027992 [Drosera rotundifolia]